MSRYLRSEDFRECPRADKYLGMIVEHIDQAWPSLDMSKTRITMNDMFDGFRRLSNWIGPSWTWWLPAASSQLVLIMADV